MRTFEEPLLPHFTGAENEARVQRKAHGMARFVQRQLAKGRTDLPAKTGFFDIDYQVAQETPDLRVFAAAKLILAQHGVAIDTYPRYETVDRHSQRLAVTAIHGEAIAPSVAYEGYLQVTQRYGEVQTPDQ